jgi:hypothetical protein
MQMFSQERYFLETGCLKDPGTTKGDLLTLVYIGV